MQANLDQDLELRNALRRLPEVPVPDRVWDQISAERARRQRNRTWMRLPGLAVAASMVMAVALTMYSFGPTPVTTPVEGGDRLTELAAQSDDLERLLARLDPDARVLDLQTADTIIALEDRIAVVDGHLRHAALDSDSAEALWRQRVELMQALVGVHLTSGQPSF